MSENSKKQLNDMMKRNAWPKQPFHIHNTVSCRTKIIWECKMEKQGELSFWGSDHTFMMTSKCRSHRNGPIFGLHDWNQDKGNQMRTEEEKLLACSSTLAETLIIVPRRTIVYNNFAVKKLHEEENKEKNSRKKMHYKQEKHVNNQMKLQLDLELIHHVSWNK